MFQSLFETCIFIILYFLCFYSFLCFRYALGSSRVQSMYLLSFFSFFLSAIVIYYEGSKNAFYISFALLPCLVTTLPRKQFLINFFICFYSRWALWRNDVKLMQRQQWFRHNLWNNFTFLSKIEHLKSSAT